MKKAAWLEKLLPFESHFLEIDGHRMHYLDEGPAVGSKTDAPVVILLHGNPTWCFFYRNLIATLRERFRVLAPDFLGCGLSDHPVDAHFRAAHRIDQLRQFVQAVGVTRYSLVMHDWGGALGTALAVDNVDAVERLVYLNTTLTETESLPLIIKAAAHPWIGKWLTKYSKRFLKFTTELGVVKKLPKYVKRGYFYPYRTRARRTAIWDFVKDIPFSQSHPSYGDMLDLAGKLPLLADKPVQIVWGLRDPCFHREMFTQVCAHFPQARICELADASHLVLEDAPEIAIPTIEGFLCEESEPGKSEPSETASENSEQNGLYAALQEVAAELPEHHAVIVPSFLGESVRYEQVRYDHLLDLIRKYERGLTELGLLAGDRVVMLVSPGVNFLALSYAVMGRGAVPFFLDPGMGREKLCDCIDEINPDVFIGSPKAQLLRMLYRKKLFPSLKFHVTATEWFFTGGPTTSFLKKFSARPLPMASNRGIALVAYTSGATGAAKGVVFTNDMVQEQLRIFVEEFGMAKGKKDMPLLPIFSLFTVAIGVCSVFPPMNPARPLAIDPPKLVKLVNDLRISYSFGSPTLWNKIAEYCVRIRNVLPSLERVYMAGAPVPAETLRLVQSILPHGTASTPYGATESLPVTLVDADAIVKQPEFAACDGELGTLVGKPVRGVQARIIRPVHGVINSIAEIEELPAGQIGEIIVRGRNVSPEYLNRPDATAASKIVDGDSFWHRMGDMGYADSDGNLYFCGRRVHAVQTENRLLYSVPVERIFNSHPKVARSALVCLESSGEAAVVIEPRPQYWPETGNAQQEFIAELRVLATQHPLTSGVTRFFFHPSFPVDGRHNAKIFRDRLGQWADQSASLQKAA